jgi:hypothetical protein
MKPIPTELRELLRLPVFRDHHSVCGSAFDDDVIAFLASTMDEVRTSTSNRVARSVMQIIEIKDFGLFRKSVLLRELTGTIAYPKQRDHSSHTLYNYLLGWYIFCQSPAVENAFAVELDKRGVGKGPWPFSTRAAYFGCVWQYVSLLHDIGYMFEGGIPSIGFRESSEQAAIGARATREYFNREIWLDYNLEVPSLRSKLFAVLGDSLKPPSFDKIETLAEIASQLRFLGGGLDSLTEPVAEGIKALGLSPDQYPEFDELSNDAFELWAQNYERFGNVAMAKRIRSMRSIFNGFIDDGLPGLGVRLLDHGVCSGLLLLNAATYYYRLYAIALKQAKPIASVKRILDGGKWSPAFWWTGIVWATAATAAHNVQQMEFPDKLYPDWPGLLSLQEDPLAYLGVLVDILEEWDRYSVFKALDSEPIQGIDVELGTDAGKIVVQFLGPLGSKRARKLKSNLSASLADWAAILEVRP